MSLKYKYLLFIGILHVVLVVLIYQLLKDEKLYFIATEVLVMISLFFSYLMYKAFIRPIELMQAGTDAIADADFSIKYVKTGSKEIDKLVDTFNTMIDKLRLERTSMAEQSYFIQNLIEVTPLGIIIMDFDGNISSINPTAKQILKIDNNSIGKNLTSYPSELVDEILKVEKSVSKVITLNGIDKYKCQVNEVIHQGFQRKFILIDDLSREFLQSEKEAYGRIIRMMAHEVNNSMGAINSILDSVMEFGFTNDEDADLKESLGIARKRNIGLSTFMANYASILRLPTPQKKRMDLIQLLKRCGQLYVPVAKEHNINITFTFPDQEITVLGDHLLLEQVISNILKNAIESIEKDGEIKVTCKDGPATFTISDNGVGIPLEIEQKLFTPFFSTKPTGQGVGLMLIRDILDNHNTTFTLKTDEATGWTNFQVVF